MFSLSLFGRSRRKGLEDGVVVLQDLAAWFIGSQIEGHGAVLVASHTHVQSHSHPRTRLKIEKTVRVHEETNRSTSPIKRSMVLLQECNLEEILMSLDV